MPIKHAEGNPEQFHPLGQEYSQLSITLEKMDPSEVEQARELAFKMKKILIEQATRSSRADQVYEKTAKDLTKLVFNKFRITDLDNLLEDLSKAQKNPIEPMRMDPSADKKT